MVSWEEILKRRNHNEDGTITIWFTKNEIAGTKCASPDNIVDYMSENDFVPCINIGPNTKACKAPRYRVFLYDCTYAMYDWYCW